MTVGGSEAIDIAMRAMLDPGDEVLIPQPSYVSYLPCCVLANGTPVIIELKAGKQFLPDTGRIRGGYHTKDKIISASISKQSNRSDYGEGRSGKNSRGRKKI